MARRRAGADRAAGRLRRGGRAARRADVHAAARAAPMTFRHLCWLILLAGGVGIEAICVVGLVTLRDAFDRLHCAGAVSLGAALVFASVVVRDSFSLIGNKAA